METSREDEDLALKLFGAFMCEFPIAWDSHEKLAMEMGMMANHPWMLVELEEPECPQRVVFYESYSEEQVLWLSGYLGSSHCTPPSEVFADARRAMIAARKTRPLAETSPGVSVLYSTNIWYDSTGTLHWEETMIDGQVTTEGYITYRGLLVGPPEIEPVDA
jgi:hypothetical protein